MSQPDETKPFSLIYPIGQRGFEFPISEAAKLGSWLRSQPNESVIVMAARAALRCAHFPLDGISGTSFSPAFREQLVASKKIDFLLACHAGALALLLGLRPELGSKLTVYKILAPIRTTIERPYSPALLVAAARALQATIDARPADPALQACLASVEASYDHAAIDPASEYSYSPTYAADATTALAEDASSIIDGTPLRQVASQPLWRQNVWAANVWPNFKTEVSNVDTEAQQKLKAPDDVIQTGFTEIPSQMRRLQVWVAWLDDRMRGADFGDDETVALCELLRS